MGWIKRLFKRKEETVLPDLPEEFYLGVLLAGNPHVEPIKDKRYTRVNMRRDWDFSRTEHGAWANITEVKFNAYVHWGSVVALAVYEERWGGQPIRVSSFDHARTVRREEVLWFDKAGIQIPAVGYHTSM